MKRRKWVEHSDILGRMFHIDVFEPATIPVGLILFFGGSGKSEAEYIRRKDSINPALDPVFERVTPNVVCLYLTAPYDIQYARPDRFASQSDRWLRHIREEVLAPWADLPVFLVGYSGGVILALSGVHNLPQIIGAAGLGADGIPEDFEPPYTEADTPAWRLYLAYNEQDGVRRANEAIIAELIDAEVAYVAQTRPGRHNFSDYVDNGCIEQVMIMAMRKTREAQSTT